MLLTNVDLVVAIDGMHEDDDVDNNSTSISSVTRTNDDDNEPYSYIVRAGLNVQQYVPPSPTHISPVSNMTKLPSSFPVSYTHLRAHETPEHLVCRLLLEKKKKL
eukprot:TRINITY_DN52200_c0_g1_i1.p1 TRINITY_DN52200_c0_g1~~TRINITY_DN52200_c0_g1_i1.p1  ORF type:complete len:105 (+),score=31.09 TRINITY_DN52200_c0_g1_i1:193-507(+)